MRRLLTFWLALLAPYWLLRSALAALLFGHAERLAADFTALLQLVAIPALGALALAWAARERSLRQLVAPWREAWRRPPLAALLATDAAFAALVCTSWLLPGRDWLARDSSSGAARLAGFLVAGKLLAAAALSGGAARTLRQPRERLAALLLAAVPLPAAAALLAVALLPAAAAAATRLRAAPELETGVAAALVALALALFLAAEGVLRRRSALAAQALEWATGLLLAATLLVPLAALRALPPPGATPAFPSSTFGGWGTGWTVAAAQLASLGATALILAGAFLLPAARAGPTQRPARPFLPAPPAPPAAPAAPPPP